MYYLIVNNEVSNNMWRFYRIQYSYGDSPITNKAQINTTSVKEYLTELTFPTSNKYVILLIILLINKVRRTSRTVGMYSELLLQMGNIR